MQNEWIEGEAVATAQLRGGEVMSSGSGREEEDGNSSEAEVTGFSERFI